MKKILFLIPLLLLSLICSAQQLAITQKGEPNSTVIIPENATPAQEYAAKEFIKYIEKISGATLPTANTPTDGNNIFIGQTDEVKSMLKGFDWSSLTYDGIYINCNGKDTLILTGYEKTGEIYSVYTFLEDYIGVKYYLSDEEYIPEKESINIGKIDFKYTPKLMSRESYYKEMYKDQPAYALKMKQNGSGFWKLPAEYGGNIKLVGFAHTFQDLMNPDIYGEEHPNWFSFRNGNRILDRRQTQPCLTNKEMVKELIRNVFDTIEKNPNEKIFSCTQYDNSNYCECENCKAMAAKYGQSGLLLTVINEIADAVKEKYPDKFIETFAYHYTQHAPTGDIKPRDNVIIRLCSIEADFSRPFDDPSNHVFMKDLTDWANISQQLYIWDYSINYPNHLMPFPNTQVLQKNMQILTQNKCIAVFSEGDEANRNAWLIRYKGYIIAKLCWDENIDMDKETRGFCNFYYGPAGKDMYDYIRFMEKTMKEQCRLLKDKLYLRENFTSIDYLTAKQWIEGFKILNRALEKVQGDSKYYKRVYDDVLGQTAGVMASYDPNSPDHRSIYKKVLEANVMPFENFMDLCEEYIKISEDREMPSPAEHYTWSNHFNNFLRYEKKYVPEFMKQFKNDEWIDYRPREVYFGYTPSEKLVKIVDDPKSSDGKAVWHTGEVKDWVFMPWLLYLFANKHSFADVYMTYRIEPNHTYDAEAMEAGVYSKKTGYAIQVKFPSNATPNGEYITQYIGTLDLDSVGNDAYFFIAGLGKPEAVKGMYLDRVIFVYRE